MKELQEAVLPPSAEWIFLDTTDLFGVHIADSVCVLLTVKGTGNVQQYIYNIRIVHTPRTRICGARTCIHRTAAS